MKKESIGQAIFRWDLKGQARNTIFVEGTNEWKASFDYAFIWNAVGHVYMGMIYNKNIEEK